LVYPVSDGMKIVVGYDGSEAATRALERAAAVASHQSEVVIVAVAEPYPRSGITIPTNRDPEEIQLRLDDLDEARRFLLARGVTARTLQARGNPAEVLVDVSKDADLVIVGSRGVDRLQRLLLGSVTRRRCAGERSSRDTEPTAGLTAFGEEERATGMRLGFSSESCSSGSR
jgi:nucleotide-binding universal stress UspA family protein